MKKILIAVFASLVISSPVNAAVEVDPISFYTVADSVSTALKNTFVLGETPWLYVHIPDQYNGNSNWTPIVASLWNHGWTFGFDQVTGAKGDREFHLSLDNWGNKEKLGTWTINGGYAYWNDNCLIRQYGDERTTFTVVAQGPGTVTPEPISMALFGLGAGVLGLAGARRKRK